MGWIDGGWAKRAAITVDLASWSSGTIDINVVLPKDWDEFWGGIDSSGNELRVTKADGYTLVSYDLAGFNATTRTCTIQVDGVTPTAGSEGVMLLWLYYSKSGAPDASTSVTITNPYSGYVELAAPRADRIIRARPEAPGASKPDATQTKEDDVTTYLWWDVTGLLHGRRERDNGSLRYEEPDFIAFAVELSGSPQGAMVNATKSRFVEYDGRMYVATLVKAGSADNYLAKLTMTTTGTGSISQVVVAKATLTVQDITEV